jgi:hypothetical protein
MDLAWLGRALKSRGRRVWVITLTPGGAVGRKAEINLWGQVRLREEKVLWRGEAPEPETLGLAGENAIVLIPRSWVLLKELAFPGLKPSQLAAVVPFELEEALPTKQVYAAWQQVPAADGAAVLAYAVREQTLTPVLQLLERAGLKLWGIAPYSWAQAKALARAVDCPEQALLVTCGQRPEFSLIQDGALLYSYQGGEDLFCELKTFLAAREKPARLIVCGQYSLALIGRLRREGFAPEEVSALPAARETVSAYLAGELPDLSPPLRKEERRLREFKLGNYFLAAIAALLLCPLLGWQAGTYHAWKERYNRATAQIAQLEARQASQLSVGPVSQRSEWLEVWARISQAVPEGAWLSELTLNIDGQLQLKGCALRQTQVADLMENLSGASFGPVILNYSRRLQLGETQVTEFNIFCGNNAN